MNNFISRFKNKLILLGQNYRNRKYLPPIIVYKYVDYTGGIRILKDRTLRLNSPTKFNDPFDCHFDFIDFSHNKRVIKKYVNYTLGHLSCEEKEKICRLFISNPNDTINKSKRKLEEIRNKISLTCFSRIHNSLLMWSHYGEKHKGFCIGFKFHPATDNYFIGRVQYKYRYPRIKYFKMSKRYTIIKRWAFTKSKNWKYEKEVRLFTYEDADLVPIEKNSIVSLYLGCSMKDKQIEEVKNLLKEEEYSNIRVSQMKISDEKFYLNEEQFIMD